VASNTVTQLRIFLIVMDDVFQDKDPRGNDGYTRVKAGEYLLRVAVVAGKHTAHRDVRFTVR
jgi:hypothetical protein